MVVQLKQSKFNFTFLDDAGDLIAYNFLRGLQSLSVVSKLYAGEFNKIVDDECILLDEKLPYYGAKKLMLELGLLVREDEDEDAYYNSLFYERVYENTLQLFILPTEDCDFGCKYCFESFDKPRTCIPKDAQNNLVKFVQKNISRYTKLSVSWFGGEPLCASETIEYLSKHFNNICDGKKVQYVADIVTNGYNLTPDMFDMLYNAKVYRYQVSVDGLKARHDSQRVRKDGSGSFDRIVSNLLHIKNSKKYKFANIIVRVNVTRGVLSEIDEFIEFYNENFADDSRFVSQFMPTGNPSLLHDDDDIFKNERYLNKDDYLEYYQYENIIYNNDKYRNAMINLNMKSESLVPMYALCRATQKNFFTLTPDLNVYKCYVLFDEPENRLGFINDRGDMVLDETANRRWHSKKELTQRCRSCYYLPCCNRGNCPYQCNWHPGRFDECIADEPEQMASKLKQDILSVMNVYPCSTIEFES